MPRPHTQKERGFSLWVGSGHETTRELDSMPNPCSIPGFITCPAMDRSRATELLKFLRDQHAFLKLKSAPSVSKFSNMPGTIAYDDCPWKVALSDLFDISEDVLMGRDTDEDKAAAVKRLKTALSDRSGAEALATLYEKVCERDQFLHIAYSLLTLLTPIVNKNTYSDKTTTWKNSVGSTWGWVTT